MKAQCTWGEGPDVLVTLEGTPLILHEKPDCSRFTHGIVNSGSLDLTLKEAEFLWCELGQAIQMVKDIEASIPDEMKG